MTAIFSIVWSAVSSRPRATGAGPNMLAQRGTDLTREQVSHGKDKPAKSAAPAPEASAPKRKMKFKEKHALETLPKTMAALNQKANELQDKLDDPQFYIRARADFEKVTTDLAETQRKLAAAEEQWLELEILRE